MKFATYLAIVAYVKAMEGEMMDDKDEDDVPVAYGAECSEELPCEDATLTCVTAEEVEGMASFCQDCAAESRTWDDWVEFACPGDESDDEDDGAKTIVASVMAVVASAALMA